MEKDKISVLFLTKYSRLGASSRYRFLQYFPYLEAHGIECRLSPLMDDRYLKHLYAMKRGSAFDIARALCRRIAVLLTAHRYDVLMVEYELLPYFPPVFEAFIKKTKIPLIVNYDDAIFYRYSQHPSRWLRRFLGNKIDAVMKSADLVIAGNFFLADYARKAGAGRVETVPSVVDLDRYPASEHRDNGIFTIGWIGSPSTSKYLEGIAPALAKVCELGRGKVVLIGSGRIELAGVPVEITPWSEEREVEDLRSCDVGIMPLYDGSWERGKCGLKTIQYMACGLPVVVSPIGVNKDMVEDGVNGFLAKDNEEWVKALSALRDDKALRERMGRSGRKKAEEMYSLQSTAPLMAALISDVARKNPRRPQN